MEKIQVDPTVQKTPQVTTWQPSGGTTGSDPQTTAFARTLKKEDAMKSKKAAKVFVPVMMIVILLGIGTGYMGASVTAKPSTIQAPTSNTEGETPSEAAASVKVNQVFGAKDADSFKDSAEGVLVPGGLDGEGSHHIVRPGGKTQTVYLTSSVVDLKMFENHKVKVWGETFSAKKAGWLMDVGRVQIQELNADLPDGAQEEAPAAVGNE